MITVNDLIGRLQEYALRDPANGGVEVMIGSLGEVIWEFEKANDIVGLDNQRFLVFIPSMTGKRFGVRTLAS